MRGSCIRSGNAGTPFCHIVGCRAAGYGSQADDTLMPVELWISPQLEGCAFQECHLTKHGRKTKNHGGAGETSPDRCRLMTSRATAIVGGAVAVGYISDKVEMGSERDA